jgi:hypothetical protein
MTQFSRRDFIRTAGMAGMAAALSSPADRLAAAPPPAHAGELWAGGSPGRVRLGGRLALPCLPLIHSQCCCTLNCARFDLAQKLPLFWPSAASCCARSGSAAARKTVAECHRDCLRMRFFLEPVFRHRLWPTFQLQSKPMPGSCRVPLKGIHPERQERKFRVV